MQTSGKHRTERERIPAPADRDIPLLSERLPKNTPLDYFDPEFFNRLPASFRVKYRNAKIALPLPEDQKPADGQGSSGYITAWKTMKYEAFMEKYGNKVQANYDIPTEEEVEVMKANGIDPDTGRELGSDSDSDSGSE